MYQQQANGALGLEQAVLLHNIDDLQYCTLIYWSHYLYSLVRLPLPTDLRLSHNQVEITVCETFITRNFSTKWIDIYLYYVQVSFLSALVSCIILKYEFIYDNFKVIFIVSLTSAFHRHYIENRCYRFRVTIKCLKATFILDLLRNRLISCLIVCPTIFSTWSRRLE